MSDGSGEWVSLPVTQAYANQLTIEEQVAVYNYLRDHVPYQERAFRDAFEVAFPGSSGRLPPIRPEEELEAEAEQWRLWYDEIHAPELPGE